MKKIFISGLLAVTLIQAEIPTEATVTQLYVGTFERAPDAAGLAYWMASGLSLEDISSSFFDQQETKDKYPTGFSDVEFVTQAYSNLFNRAPDSEGLDYWTAALADGTATRDTFLLATINGAQGDDASIMANKTTAGLAFAQSGQNDLDDAEAIIDPITADPQSVVDTLCTATLGECYNPVVDEPTVDEPTVPTAGDASPSNEGPVIALTSITGTHPIEGVHYAFDTEKATNLVATITATDTDTPVAQLWTIPSAAAGTSSTLDALTLTVNVSGATYPNSDGIAAAIPYKYSVTASDSQGTSTTEDIIVNFAKNTLPTFDMPANVTADPASDLVLTVNNFVDPDDGGALTYQWMVGGTDLVETTDGTGTTTAELTVTAGIKADGNSVTYQFKATDGYGGVSTVGTVTVTFTTPTS